MRVNVAGIRNEDIIQGFPGLPATDPRAVGLLTVYPSKQPPVKGKKSLGIQKINISLVRTDAVNVSGNKKEMMFLVSQQDLFAAARGQEVYALELPFALPIGKSGKVTASMAVPERTMSTTFALFVRIQTDAQVQEPAYKFPVYVRRYDTLSTFQRYLKPFIKNISSPDHLANVQFTLAASAFGHGDKILAYFHVSPNPDYSKAKKVKLLRISLELVQKVTFLPPSINNNNEKLPDPRRTRMAKESTEFEELYIRESTVQAINLQVPSHPQAAMIDRYNVGPPCAEDVPDQGRLGFTNSCAMFEISFLLVFKVRFRHARDIEFETPVTICQFDHPSCVEYVKSIVQTAELAQYSSGDYSGLFQSKVVVEPLNTNISIS